MRPSIKTRAPIKRPNLDYLMSRQPSSDKWAMNPTLACCSRVFLLVSSADLKSRKVNVDCITTLPSAFCGQAYIFLYPTGNNSIITVGGANTKWNPTSPFTPIQLEALRQCRVRPSSIGNVLLLQREVPEFVNVAASKIVKEHSDLHQ